MYLFDPRVGGFVDTDNPILIMADIMIRSELVEPDKKFWNRIRLLAEYADKPIKGKELKDNLIKLNNVERRNKNFNALIEDDIKDKMKVVKNNAKRRKKTLV